MTKLPSIENPYAGATYPIVFPCRDRDRPWSNLGQIVLIPLLGLFGGLFAGVLVALPISHMMGMASPRVAVLFFGVSAATAMGLSYFAWRSFRQRLQSEFHIWPDRVEVVRGSNTQTICHSETRARHTVFHKIMLGEPDVLILPNDGPRMRLRHHDWNTREIDKALDFIATEVQLPVARQAIERGDAVLFEEPHALARWKVISIGVVFLFGMLGLGMFFFRWIGSGDFRFTVLLRSVVVLAGATALLRWLRIYTSGGVELSRFGIRPADRLHGTELRWHDVRAVRWRKGCFEIHGPETSSPIRFDFAIANRALLFCLIGALAGPDIEWNLTTHE